MCQIVEAAEDIVGDRAGATINFFGAGERGAGIRCSAGLGGSSFGGKSSWGERVAVGRNICVLGYFYKGVLGWEMCGSREIFREGVKPPTRTRRGTGRWRKIVFCNGFR